MSGVILRFPAGAVIVFTLRCLNSLSAERYLNIPGSTGQLTNELYCCPVIVFCLDLFRMILLWDLRVSLIRRVLCKIYDGFCTTYPLIISFGYFLRGLSDLSELNAFLYLGDICSQVSPLA